MEVKLHETENPWKPARLRGSQADRDKTEDLYNKVCGILNKLTPQKLDTLVHQMWILPVNSNEQLHGIVNLVFDKAIAEPRYSVVYAQMCKMLSNMRAVGSSEEGQPEKFRKLLLNRCRQEFENPQADLKRDEHLEEIERCTDPEKKKELQLEFEEMESQLRRKSLGFIRFVGELFKLGMLTSNVLHRYIQRLLKRRDEVSLECLCELLTITGKHIETTEHNTGQSLGVVADFAARVAKAASEKMRPPLQQGQVSSTPLQVQLAQVRRPTPPLPSDTQPKPLLQMGAAHGLGGPLGNLEDVFGPLSKCPPNLPSSQDHVGPDGGTRRKSSRPSVPEVIDPLAWWTSSWLTPRSPQPEKEKGKEKGENEKQEREEEAQGEKNKEPELNAVPNKVNAKLPAAALEERKGDEIVKNIPPKPALPVPKQMYREGTDVGFHHLSAGAPANFPPGGPMGPQQGGLGGVGLGRGPPQLGGHVAPHQQGGPPPAGAPGPGGPPGPPQLPGPTSTPPGYAGPPNLGKGPHLQPQPVPQAGQLSSFQVQNATRQNQSQMQPMQMRAVCPSVGTSPLGVRQNAMYLSTGQMPMFPPQTRHQNPANSAATTATYYPQHGPHILMQTPFAGYSPAHNGQHGPHYYYQQLSTRPAPKGASPPTVGPGARQVVGAPGPTGAPQVGKEKGKEKGEKEKQKREEEAEGEKNKELELIAMPNKVNAKLPAAALVETKGDEIVENIPSKPVLPVPRLMYREDQWSPFNPAGKKKYERDFLIKLKDTREAKKKPEIRPDVLNFVLKDKVNRPRLPDLSRGLHDNFTPAFTKSQSSRGDLSKYFEEMKVLSKQCGQISSRVRFMLQGVIELRDNKWVPRRHASVLETLDEIQHEAMCESVEMQMPFRGGSTSHSGSGGHVEQAGDWRKRGGRSEDGRKSVLRKNYDNSKLRIKVSDLMNVSLDSKQFAAWTQGAGSDSDSDCSSAYSQRGNTSADLQNVEDRIGQLYGIRTRSSSTERAKLSNTQSDFACGGHRKDDEESLKKYCYLDNSKLRIKVSDLTNISLHENDRFATWTQGDGGSSAFPQTRNTFAGLHDFEDKKSGVSMFSRPYGKQPVRNTEREKAVETLRQFVLAEKEERQARIASSGTPSRSTSHDDSSARQTSSPSSSQSCNGLAAAAQPVASISYAISDRDTQEHLPHLSPNQVAKKVQFILEEFVNNNNLLESAVSVSETFPPSNMDSFITGMINISLERSAPVRSSVGKLMGHLMREGILTRKQFLERFKQIAVLAEYSDIDVPKVRLYFAEIFVPMLSTEALSFSDLKTAATGLHELLVEILHLLVKEKGPRWIRQRWDVAGISWKDFAPAHLIDRIVKENKLEFTVGPADEMVPLTPEAIHTKLLQMLRPEQGAPATTREVSEWISANVGDRAKTPEFIRVLTTAVCESAYQASSSKKFEEALFSKHATLLQKYIDTNEELELHCLYAVQELNQHLEQPSGLLCSLFQALWDFGCVANETFLKWQQSRDPAFLQGKGVALKSLTAFFTALREADNDSSKDCASDQ